MPGIVLNIKIMNIQTLNIKLTENKDLFMHLTTFLNLILDKIRDNAIGEEIDTIEASMSQMILLELMFNHHKGDRENKGILTMAMGTE